METYAERRWIHFITPLGGVIAFACFFMPWVNIDTIDNSALSAYKFFITLPLGPASSLITIAFIASIVIVGINLYMLNRRTPWKSRVPTLISSGIGLAILLEHQFVYVKIIEKSDINFSLNEFGFWGTIIGFAIAVVGVFFIRTIEVNGQTEVTVEQKQLAAIVLTGGIIAFPCFFIPWEGTGNFTGASGFQLVKLRPLVAIVFTASIIIVAGSLYTLVRGTSWKLRALVLVSISIGLGILFCYYIHFYFSKIGHANISREFNLEIIKRSIKLGYWGTVFGYVVAAVGIFLTTRKNKDTQIEIPAESG